METDFLLSYIQNVFDVFSQGSFAVFAGVMALGGWLVIVWLLFFAGLHLYGEMLEDRYKKDWEWVLLAIDVPIENVQTPKAVEQTFNHLAGALENASFPEQYIYGHKQRWFSFEIISIEGYIQFLIRTERKFYDLVVASIYAQYPNAEVIEVEDYVNNVPEKYPNEFYNIWGADFGLAEHEAFPLRMYEQFKNSIGKDIVLSDPMGTFLESFSRIGAGE